MKRMQEVLFFDSKQYSMFGKYELYRNEDKTRIMAKFVTQCEH
jgi:hypothetical protein